MITREQIVAEARSWIGTPFHHQARLKGVGVDCIGIVFCVAHAFAMSDYDTTGYPRIPDPEKMRIELERVLVPIPRSDLQPADVLWLRVAGQPRHVGLVTETTPDIAMVHAYGCGTIDRVIEQRVSPKWALRIEGCYRYRGLA